jgi:hypothetical protein
MLDPMEKENVDYYDFLIFWDCYVSTFLGS